MEDIDQSQAFTQEPTPAATAARQAARAEPPPAPEPGYGTDPDTAWLGDMATNEPTWFDRWGRRAAIWLSGGIASAFVLIGALWLYGERKIDSAMAVLAMSSRTLVAPAPVLAAQPYAGAGKAASTLPPLVMLPHEEVVPPSRPTVKMRPARAAAVAPPATAKPAIKPAAKRAIKPAVRANRAGVKAAATKKAAKPASVRKRRADPVLASAAHKQAARARSAGRPQKMARAMPAKRCQTGDLARDCLADLCKRERNQKACRAAARLRLH